MAAGVGVMFVPIIRRVREQPDTGYRKSLLSYFATTLGGLMLFGLIFLFFNILLILYYLRTL